MENFFYTNYACHYGNYLLNRDSRNANTLDATKSDGGMPCRLSALGRTKKYAEGWDKAFGKGKKKTTKSAAPKEKVAKKATKKKAASKARRRAPRRNPNRSQVR